MKPQVVLSLSLLTLTTMIGEITNNSESIISVAGAVSGQISNGQIMQIQGNVQLKRASTNLIRASKFKLKSSKFLNKNGQSKQKPLLWLIFILKMV